jgi:hypothetical protein
MRDKKVPPEVAQIIAGRTKAVPKPGPEGRREPRRVLTGIARLAQRTRVILDADEQDTQACKILDSSDSGYRIALTTERQIEGEIILEHTDGSRRRVRVRWVSGREVGLEIIKD